MNSYFSIKRGGFGYILSVVVFSLIVGFGCYKTLPLLQKALFQSSGEVLYYGYLMYLLPIFLGSIVALCGVILGSGTSGGKIKARWRSLALYVVVAGGTVLWLTPGALLNFLGVSRDQIIVSDASWTHRSVHKEAYGDILYAVDTGSAPDIYFGDGSIFKGISDFKDFADRYRANTGNLLKLYCKTKNGIGPLPD